MEAQQVNTQSQDTEPNAYPDRDSDDMEEVVEHLEEGSPEENQVVGEFIDRVDGEIRDEVGATNHFEAPIRSLNHPQNPSVVTEDGRRLQVAGEEFGQLNNVFPEYSDIGNIQYWVAATPGIYDEEDWNDGGEHIVGGESEDVQAYAVRIDGEFRTAEEINEIMEDMNIRQANNLFGGMEVPELMVEHETVQEAVENEDISEDEFHDQYRKARQTGLITDNGNLTLKGLLRAVDMEARDLRNLETLEEDSDSVTFRSLDHENFPYLGTEDIIGHDATVNFSTGLWNLDDQTTEGEVNRGEPGEEFQERLRELEESIGFSVPELSSSHEEEYNLTLAEYTRNILGQDIPGRVDLERLDDAEAAEMAETAYRSDASIEKVSMVEEPELEIEDGDIDQWSDMLGYTEEELREELRTNTEIVAKENGEGVKLSYTGERDEMKPLIEGFRGNNRGSRVEDDQPIAEMRGSTSINEVYLELLPFRDQLEDRVDFDDERGTVYFGTVKEYDKLESGIKDKIDELEEEGVIDTEESFNGYDGEVRIDADDPIQYREAIEELNNIEALEFDESSVRYKKRTKVDLGHVKTKVSFEIDDEEKMKEELDGLLEEVRDHGLSKFVRTTEEVPEYDKIGNNDLKHQVNRLLDSIDNRYLTKAARTVIDEPDIVEDTRHEHKYSEMRGTLREYEVKDRHDRPSDELLEKLGELYDKGIIEAEREIGEPYDDFENRRFDYPDPSDGISLDNYGEMSKQDKERLQQLEEEGLINLREPSKELEVETNYGETDRVRMNAEARYGIEELDIEQGEMQVTVEYEPGEDQVYEPNQELETIASHLNPVEMRQQPFDQIEMETSFEYEAA